MVALNDVKTALRITTNDFDDEIESLMATCIRDLEIRGVIPVDDKLIDIAVVTYVKMRFGNPDNYDRLKKSYDEQKAQLSMATGFTMWSV